MPNPDWLYHSLEKDYDAIVARQRETERLRALQDAQDKGATIEETMANAYDRIGVPNPVAARSANFPSEQVGVAGDVDVPATASDPNIVPAMHHFDDFPESPVTREIRDFWNHQESMPMRDRGEGYSSRNPQGPALGMYQFQHDILADLGLKPRRPAAPTPEPWTPPREWLPNKYGIGTDDDFLARPEVQEALLPEAIRKYESYLRGKRFERDKAPAAQREGTWMTLPNQVSIPIRMDELIVAAHRAGAERTGQFLDELEKNGGVVDSAWFPRTAAGELTERGKGFQAIGDRLMSYVKAGQPHVWVGTDL